MIIALLISGLLPYLHKYILISLQSTFVGNKLADDSQKYGTENTCTSGNTLSKAATYYGKARSLIEKERGNMLKAFGTQVCFPCAGFFFLPCDAYGPNGWWTPMHPVNT